MHEILWLWKWIFGIKSCLYPSPFFSFSLSPSLIALFRVKRNTRRKGATSKVNWILEGRKKERKLFTRSPSQLNYDRSGEKEKKGCSIRPSREASRFDWIHFKTTLRKCIWDQIRVLALRVLKGEEGRNKETRTIRESERRQGIESSLNPWYNTSELSNESHVLKVQLRCLREAEETFDPSEYTLTNTCLEERKTLRSLVSPSKIERDNLLRYNMCSAIASVCVWFLHSQGTQVKTYKSHHMQLSSQLIPAMNSRARSWSYTKYVSLPPSHALS